MLVLIIASRIWCKRKPSSDKTSMAICFSTILIAFLNLRR